MNQFCRLLAPALESYAAATGLGDPTLDDDVVADLLSYLRHWCHPYDSELDEAILPEIAADIARRFDSTEIYGQIDELCCLILREHGIDPSAPAAAGDDS
jgi:hypothetical protein